MKSLTQSKSLLFFLLLNFVFLGACSNAVKEEKGKTQYGVDYILYKGDVSTKKAVKGEVFKYRNFQWVKGKKNEMIAVKEGTILPYIYDHPQSYGNIDDLLAIMSPGDSAIFFINTDMTNPADNEGRGFMPGDTLMVALKVEDIISEEQFRIEFIDDANNLLSNQITEIKNYLKDNQINEYYLNADNNMAFTIENQGTGLKPQEGDSVTIHYVIRTLKGKVLNNSYEGNKPFTWTLGSGVIWRLWDSWMPTLREGGKGTIYLPSEFAYGIEGIQGFVAPRSIIVVQVELLKVYDI